MNARSLMNSDVMTVTPDTSIRDVARTLLEHHISTVPVVDESGTPIGMVGEGDLVGRKPNESEWWLQRLASGQTLITEFLRHLQSPNAVAREVMSSPVLTVGEETPAEEIAGIMAKHRVKRIPVVRDGRIVGTVCRFDVLRALGGEPAPGPLPAATRGKPIRPWRDKTRSKGNGKANSAPITVPARAARDARPDGELSVSDFRDLAMHHDGALGGRGSRARALAAELRRKDVHRLIDTHITDKEWNRLIHGARQAAEHGQTKFLLLRFPHQLCSDGGRAVNAPDPEWPRTLRGEAAEMYSRWERELRPRGFHLSARVVDFPDGMPGDIGLFLVWSEAEYREAEYWNMGTTAMRLGTARPPMASGEKNA